MINKFNIGVTCAYLTIISINANAALIGVLPVTSGGTDYQAYYDNVADLTWLTDANAAGTTMNWIDANAWAGSLNISGISGWRLPDTLQPDASCSIQGTFSSGTNCTGSEMGNLFYNVLGNTSATLINNTGPFSNVKTGFYWSATDRGLSAPKQAFVFDMNGDGGAQTDINKLSNVSAWAVYSGNVSAVPVPAAAWLFGSGLIGLVGFAKRKKA